MIIIPRASAFDGKDDRVQYLVVDNVKESLHILIESSIMSNNKKVKDTPKPKIQLTLFGINNYDINKTTSRGLAKTLEKWSMSFQEIS